MEIPRSLLNDLTREVNALSGAAQQQAGIAIDNVLREWDGTDLAALREALTQALDAVLSTYTDLSAARASEFYAEARGAQGVKRPYEPVADPARNPDATAGAVRALVGSVAATGGTDRLRSDLLARVDTETRRAANECVARNVLKDPAKPRYARVPQGETCGFCLMLSSFGFRYRTEESASHAHPKCNCRVVPSFGKATVKGYDPDGMYDRFNECLDALGGRDGIRADWNALPSAERDAYIRAHGNKAGKAFDAYVNKRMAAEIETRDPEWFETGREPEPEYLKPRSALLDHERKGVDWLKRNGFKVSVLPEDPKASANPDLKMNGRLWEMKNITNSGSSVSNQVKRARIKWFKKNDGTKMHAVFTTVGATDGFDKVVGAISGKMRPGEQALVLGDDGIARIRK